MNCNEEACLSTDRRETIIVGGYAQFPEGITGHEVFGVLGMGLEVDAKTGEIVGCDASFVTEQPRDFLRGVVIGKNIEKNGIQEAVEEINRRYFARGKKAIISALYDASNNYAIYKKSKQ